MNTQLAKWGNSLAVRIPKQVAEQAHLREGDRLELNVTSDGTVVLKSAKPAYAIEHLVEGITLGNRHAETDWGQPMGKELW